MTDTHEKAPPPPGDPIFQTGNKNQSAEETSSQTNLRPEREPALKDYIRTFSYGNRWDLFMGVLACLAAIGSGTAMPLMNVIFGQLVGQFTGYFMEPPTLSRSDFESLLDRQALYIMGLFLGRFGLTIIHKFCFRMIGIRLSSAIRLHYLQCLFGQSIHVLDSMPPGSAASTITTTANTLQLGISEKLGTFMEYNGTIWAAVIVAFTWRWDLTLVTASVILFMLLVIAVLLPFIIKFHTAATKADGKATAVASEAFGGIRMLAACGAEDRVAARFNRWVVESRRKGQMSAPLLGLQMGLVVRTCLFFSFLLFLFFSPPLHRSPAAHRHSLNN